ncbi:MAG: CDP-diacylglycerol--serine O-phosphatidyltransferase [Cellvibrionaceae bacterium]|nr:CDP-diacylglycerol--serine O-phosphatidyltransferase [Cellvibrionaceae bacterium]
MAADNLPDQASGSASSDQSERPRSTERGLENYIPVDEHIEEVSEHGRRVRHKGVYLLPNLLTTAALFSGFYAIVVSMSGQFEAAAIAIFVAMIFDGLDGRVARLTNTSSAFGVEYDSLADMVSFGLAPAIVALNWGLAPLDKLAWGASFVFAVCVALRLARFNTQTAFADKRFFIGLASPPGAAVVAAIIWVWHDHSVTYMGALMVALIMVFLGLLMVSNLKYNSFKGIDLKGRIPFVRLLIVVLVFAAIASNPPQMLLLFAVCYGLSGPVLWVWSLLRRAT